jgi:hypothetical protein
VAIGFLGVAAPKGEEDAMSGARTWAAVAVVVAAAGAEGAEAEDYGAVVEAMRAGEELDDRPHFESFPG